MSNHATFNVEGTTMERAQGWVQEMSAIPASVNPLFDETGKDAWRGDTGDVHYLAGNFGGTSTREFEVDYGDTLVLPMLNVWSEELTSGPVPNARDEVLNLLESVNITDVYLRVDLHNDGKYEYGDAGEVFNVKNAKYYPEVRFQGNSKEAEQFFLEPKDDDAFVFRVPGNNIYDVPHAGSSESYTAGYYAQIEDLPEGTHRIEFGGTAPGADFAVEIVDLVTVVDNGDDMIF